MISLLGSWWLPKQHFCLGQGMIAYVTHIHCTAYVCMYVHMYVCVLVCFHFASDRMWCELRTYSTPERVCHFLSAWVQYQTIMRFDVRWHPLPYYSHSALLCTQYTFPNLVPRSIPSFSVLHAERGFGFGHTEHATLKSWEWAWGRGYLSQLPSFQYCMLKSIMPVHWKDQQDEALH